MNMGSCYVPPRKQKWITRQELKDFGIACLQAIAAVTVIALICLSIVTWHLATK